MFFGLMNLLATFQTIMNEIFCNLINTREVMSFINDIIVKIEDEEDHNEVVGEVVRRLVENNNRGQAEKKLC